MKLVERRKWVVEDIKTRQEERENCESSVKPLYLKRWSKWMKRLTKIEECDQYKLTMMVSHAFSFAR
jgi:hypothetical protein